ncbi:MAG: UDP-N-acetylmuramate dehydrogenase [Gammaproteobacteria bacterium]
MMTAQTQQSLRGELRHDVAMSGHTSWRVGGVADQCFRPADLDDLQLFLQRLDPEERLYWVGLGSNLLVRDGGLRGTVILPFNGLDTLALLSNNEVRVGAGVTCARVARFCARADLVGAEFFAGIPGTMGGALAMNAGAFGGETWEIVKRVETVNHAGVLHDYLASDFQVGYRSVNLPDNEWFISTVLILQPGDGAAAQQRSKALLEQRGKTQPTSQPSCGSVFRNPEGDYAARLIESCQLKGQRIGNAEVSEKHANFIVNLGAASAENIEQLILHVQQTVEQQTGVCLQHEVRIIGESLPEVFV